MHTYTLGTCICDCMCRSICTSLSNAIFFLRLLLKKFRIPQENPIIWQLGLVEREINEILHGYLKRQTPETTVTSSKSRGHSVVKRKDIGLEDVCPICQDELLGTTQILTYCKFGCGNSVHNKCMKIWADHQKSTGEVTVRCPLCREDFGPLKEMPLESSRRLRAVKASVHLGVACTHCHVCPILWKVLQMHTMCKLSFVPCLFLQQIKYMFYIRLSIAIIAINHGD